MPVFHFSIRIPQNLRFKIAAQNDNPLLDFYILNHTKIIEMACKMLLGGFWAIVYEF